MIHMIYLPLWQLNQWLFKCKPVSGHILTFCRIRQGVPGQSLWSGLKLFGIKFAFFHSWLHLCFEYLGMFLVACWQNSTGKKFVKLALLAARKLSDCKVEMWETSHSAQRTRTFGCYTPLEKICCNVTQKPQRSDKARRRLLEHLTKLLLDFLSCWTFTVSLHYSSSKGLILNIQRNFPLTRMGCPAMHSVEDKIATETVI